LPSQQAASTRLSTVNARYEAASDAPSAFSMLNQRYKAASPEQRRALPSDPVTKDVLKRAADWVFERPIVNEELGPPLSPVAFCQWLTDSQMHRLADLTQGVDPALAAQLVNTAMPTFERDAATTAENVGYVPLSKSASHDLQSVLQRVGQNKDIKHRFEMIFPHTPGHSPQRVR